MANPILAGRDSFTARTAPAAPGPYAQFGQQQYGQQSPYAQYDQTGQYGQPGQLPAYGQTAPGYGMPAATDSMTLDSVIAKTGITMAVLIASAVVSFMMLDYTLYTPALVVSSIVGFVTVLFVSTRKVVNPALVLLYAAVEGVFIGGLTRIFETLYPGIAAQAVMGTFAAAGATLAAYKYLHVRVSSRARRFVFIATGAFAALMLVNFLLALAGIDTGLRSHGPLGFVAALVGIGLAVFNLLVDFGDIDRGIAGNAPANESWRAAFGLTVTMVWMYTEILRILSYFQRR